MSVEQSVENDAGREPGEAYYVENGWSGCAGSAWRTLPPAARDGWAHAERVVAGLRYRMAEAWDEGYTCGNRHNGRRDANPYRPAPPAALGTPKNPVDGATHPCPTPGYAGRHTAVGAGAISPPYVCHGCQTWFVLPEGNDRA